MAESEELKILLMKVKEESEKVGFKFNFQRTKIMASGPITSWQIGGETVADLYFLGAPKSLQMVTAAMKLKDATSLVAQRLRHLPPMWEIRVQSLGQEHPLEKEMETDFSILAWRIPWTEEPGRLQSTGSQKVRHD